MMHFIRVSDGLSRVFGVASMLLLAASALVVTQMVAVRYVFNGSTIWQTEFVIYATIASTFLGAPYVLLHKGHVGVDLLPRALPPSAGKALMLVGALIGLGFCALVTWSSWDYFHEAWRKGWTTDTVWAIPLWIPLLPLPLGMGMLCVQYVAEILKSLTTREGGSAHGSA